MKLGKEGMLPREKITQTPDPGINNTDVRNEHPRSSNVQILSKELMLLFFLFDLVVIYQNWE